MGRAFDRAEYTPSYAALAANGIQINGNMEVAQDVTFGTLLTLGNGVAKYICDQWQAAYSHAAATAVFKAQVTGPQAPPLGIDGKYLELTATTSSNMGTTTDYAFIQQLIEGYRWQRLAYGVANARSCVIGFWAFATVAGVASVAIRNSAANRSYVANFTINNPNTFEYKTVVIPGDVTGTWLATTAVGAQLTFCFGGGATYNGVDQTWSASNNVKTVSNTNFFATNNNRVIIAGVTVMPGTDVPNSFDAQFLHRPYDVELLLCQRYFYNGQPPIRGVVASGTNASRMGARHPVPMRVVPTISIPTPIPLYDGSGTTVSSGAAASSNSTTTVLEIDVTAAVALTPGRPVMIYQNAGGNIEVNARLP
jgi:hypothetical protein